MKKAPPLSGREVGDDTNTRPERPKPQERTPDLGFSRHGIRRLRCCAAAASPSAGPGERAAVWARARRDPPAEAGGRGEEGGEG